MTTENKVEWVILEPAVLDPDSAAFQHEFNRAVVGQEQAQAIALQARERFKNPLRDPTKPIAVYVLIGPSRTGKTRTAKTCAKLFHGSEEALTIIEAGDYVEKHQMLDLTGATPTYVGYVRPDEVRRLGKDEVDGTSKVSAHNMRRMRGASTTDLDIVCINEFEKGCPEFFRFWMGVFDNGFTVHGNGLKTDFRNTIFFITMNLGMDEVERLERGGPGFVKTSSKVTSSDIEGIVAEAMKRAWPPEFRNRLTQIVIFRPLTKDEILQICALELEDVQNRINERLKTQGFVLEVSEAAGKWLVDQAFKNNGSVAELKRIVEREVTDKLGRELLKGTLRDIQCVSVDVASDGGKLTFRAGRAIVAAPTEGAPPAETFAFRLQEAKSRMRDGTAALNHYELWLMSESAEEIGRFKTELEQLMTDVFGIRPVSEYNHSVEPYMTSRTIQASPEIMQLMRESISPRFPNLKIVKLKPTA